MTGPYSPAAPKVAIFSIDKDGDSEFSDLGYFPAGSGSGPDDTLYNMLYPQEH